MNCIKCKTELPDGAIFCHMCGKRQQAEPRKTLKRANGTGTVYKLSGRRRKPWVAAKNKVILGYYERKTDALEALERTTGKSITELYNYTFEQVFQEWSKEHYRTLSSSGIFMYNHSYAVFKSLHNKKFRSLKTADFQAVIDSHTNQAYSTLSKYKQLVTQMSKWAMREEIITTNLASFVKLPKNIAKEKQTFTQEEIDKLTADGSETAMIILMMIYTGMRIGEIFALKTENVHETYVIGGEKTEAGRNRIIPIRAEGRAYFKYFKDIAQNDIFLSGYSKGLNIFSFRACSYYPLLEKLGIRRLTPHAARHTYASWAVSQGMQPEVLQKILGHAKYSTTAEIYVHSDLEKLIQAVDDADSSFVSNPKQTEQDKQG